jgi:hypothetical protein
MTRRAAAPVPSGYPGTPLPRKPGIKAGSCVLLVDAPAGFGGMLQPWPEGVVLVDKAGLRLVLRKALR